MLDSKERLVYVAHPYGGEEHNKKQVEIYISRIIRDYPDVVPVSPIHNLGFLYHSMTYIEGMEQCLHLLSMCTELWLCAGWENSKGCCMEYAYAKGRGIKIYEIKLEKGEVIREQDRIS